MTVTQLLTRQPPVFARLRGCLGGEIGVGGCEMADAGELEPRHPFVRFKLSQPAL
jgi:hypothetical protein